MLFAGEIKRNSQGLQTAVEQSTKEMACGEGDPYEIQIISHSPQHTHTMGNLLINTNDAVATIVSS